MAELPLATARREEEETSSFPSLPSPLFPGKWLSRPIFRFLLCSEAAWVSLPLSPSSHSHVRVGMPPPTQNTTTHHHQAELGRCGEERGERIGFRLSAPPQSLSLHLALLAFIQCNFRVSPPFLSGGSKKVSECRGGRRRQKKQFLNNAPWEPRTFLSSAPAYLD